MSDVAESAQEKLGGWPQTRGLLRSLRPQRENCRGNVGAGQELSQGMCRFYT